MAMVKMGKADFLKSMEPSIASYVMQEFEGRLQEKMEAVIEEVYEEMRKELPEKIEAKTRHFFEASQDTDQIDIQVNLSE